MVSVSVRVSVAVRSNYIILRNVKVRNYNFSIEVNVQGTYPALVTVS